MTKSNLKYLIVLLVIFSGFIAMQWFAPKPISWTATYASGDKQPYGGYLLRENLSTLFPNQEVQETRKRAYRVLRNRQGSDFNYIFICNYFEPDRLDIQNLLEAAREGATVFVSANGMVEAFADSLKVSVADSYLDLMGDAEDSLPQSNAIYYWQESVNFTNPGLAGDSSYVYNKGLSNYYFDAFDSTATTILATNDRGHAHFLRKQCGEGSIYLHTLPRLFTNYNIAHPRNHEYAFKALSYLPVATTYLDQFYNVIIQREVTPLRFLLQNRSLKYAWFVMLLAVLAFLVFNSKRLQRVIPVVKPLQNTTLAFVDIISRLYFEKGNHTHIARKKIDFFLANIRDKYRLSTNLIDENFYRKLSLRSGNELTEIKELFMLFDRYSHQQVISENELMDLNQKLEDFKKNSN